MVSTKDDFHIEVDGVSFSVYQGYVSGNPGAIVIKTRSGEEVVFQAELDNSNPGEVRICLTDRASLPAHLERAQPTPQLA